MMIRWWVPKPAILISLVLFVTLLFTLPTNFKTSDESLFYSSEIDGPAVAEDDGSLQPFLPYAVTTYSSDDTVKTTVSKTFVATQSTAKSPTLNTIFNCKSTTDPIILLVDVGDLLSDIRMKTLRSWRDCEQKCCYTQDWDEFVDVADLVAFPTFLFPDIPFLRDLNQSSILTWQETNQKQLWQAVAVDSPYNHRRRGQEIDGVFHWIGNYRPDADVQFSYGSFEKIEKTPTLAEGFVHTWRYQNLFLLPPPSSHRRPKFEEPKKKKMAAWLTGRCESGSRREFLVKRLQKYVQVDVYGDCGPFKCIPEAYCHEYLAANYKFYLAFENSLCIDYVTDKMWAPLSQEILPITYSWINDTSVLPPHSYINALDFGSVKELAEYMIYLDRNEEEYRKYFQWKKEYRVIEGGDGLCSTCAKLWQHRNTKDSSARMKFNRHESVIDWMNALPEKYKNGDDSDRRAEFRIGKQKIVTNKTCADPFDHKILMNWIRDVKE